METLTFSIDISLKNDIPFLHQDIPTRSETNKIRAEHIYAYMKQYPGVVFSTEQMAIACDITHHNASVNISRLLENKDGVYTIKRSKLYLYGEEEQQKEAIFLLEREEKNTTPKHKKTPSITNSVNTILTTYNGKVTDILSIKDGLRHIRGGSNISEADIIKSIEHISEKVGGVTYNKDTKIAQYYNLEMIENIQKDFCLTPEELTYKKQKSIVISQKGYDLLQNLLSEENKCCVLFNKQQVIPRSFIKTLNGRFEEIGIPYKIIINKSSKIRKVYFSTEGIDKQTQTTKKIKTTSRQQKNFTLSKIVELSSSYKLNENLDIERVIIKGELKLRKKGQEAPFPLNEDQTKILYHMLIPGPSGRKKTYDLQNMYEGSNPSEVLIQALNDKSRINEVLRDYGLYSYQIQ